jgi:hypothetical protein
MHGPLRDVLGDDIPDLTPFGQRLRQAPDVAAGVGADCGFAAFLGAS